MHEVRELDSRPLGISAVDLHRPVFQPMDLQGLGFKVVGDGKEGQEEGIVKCRLWTEKVLPSRS